MQQIRLPAWAHLLEAYIFNCQLDSAQEAEEQERRDKEAADLEDEAAKRRQRVALWQEQRRAAQQAEDAEMRKREEAAEAWTLEDDFDHELGQVRQALPGAA